MYELVFVVYFGWVAELLQNSFQQLQTHYNLISWTPRKLILRPPPTLKGKSSSHIHLKNLYNTSSWNYPKFHSVLQPHSPRRCLKIFLNFNPSQRLSHSSPRRATLFRPFSPPIPTYTPAQSTSYHHHHIMILTASHHVVRPLHLYTIGFPYSALLTLFSHTISQLKLPPLYCSRAKSFHFKMYEMFLQLFLVPNKRL